MPISKYGSEGVHKPRGININKALAIDAGAGHNFAQELTRYTSDAFGTTTPTPIDQSNLPHPYGWKNSSFSGNIPYYDYSVGAISAPYNDTVCISMGGTDDDITAGNDQYGNGYYSYVHASVNEGLQTVFQNPYPTGVYMNFEVYAAPKLLTGTEECRFGARSLSANNTYTPRSPSMKWGITASKHFPSVANRQNNSGLVNGEYGARREFVVTYDSTDTGSETVAFFYSSETIEHGGGLGGGITHGGWHGGWVINQDAEIFWELDLVYDRASDDTAGALRVLETLVIDGVEVFAHEWPRSQYAGEWDWHTRVDQMGCLEDKYGSYFPQGRTDGNADLRWGTSYPEFYNGVGDDRPTTEVYTPLSQRQYPKFNWQYTYNDPHWSAFAAFNFIGEHLPPIDWYFSEASFHLNSKDFFSWASFSGTGTDAGIYGLLEVAFSNLEYGMLSQTSPPNGRWLGQPAATSGYDFTFPAGNHADVTTYTTADRTKRDILRFSSLKPKVSKAVIRRPASVPDDGYLKDTANPYYEFGIESGGLPDGYFLDQGVITLDQDIQYDTAAGLTGTVQFWAIGEEGVKVTSDVYSWVTQGDLFAYWDNPIHSGTPTGVKPEVKNANIWVVGDNQMTMNAVVSGGVPPYNLTTPYLDFDGSNVLQQPADVRLVYNDSDGSVTLPAAANDINKDFVSTRGYVSLRDCEVYDSVGAYYDDWRGYRCQVMYPVGRVEWHECGAFPYASGDPCQRDQYRQPAYYTPDPNYDLTLYSDRLDYFGFYIIDEAGESARVTNGVMDVTAGAMPSGVLSGYSDFSDFYYEWNQGATTQSLQIGAHTEAHNATGSFTTRVKTLGGTAVFSRTHTWICKTDGDYCTFDYGDYVHTNATPDVNYDHVWADGYDVLEVDPDSLADRHYNSKYTLYAGTLPEGVSLQEDTGDLSMDGALLGGADTGTYTIQLVTSDKGIRRMTYTWKREGLAPI